MLKFFHRNLSNLSSDLLKLKMTSARYFPNKMPDNEGQDLDLKPVHDFVIKFVEKTIKNIEKCVKPIERNGFDGLYLGTAGISYMYYHLSKNPVLKDHKPRFLNKAVEYLTPALTVAENSSPKDEASFILGSCGVYAVSSAIYQALGDRNRSEHFRKVYYKIGKMCTEKKSVWGDTNELFVGRAGYLLGALWLAQETSTELPLNDIYFLCNEILESGRKYAQKRRCPCPLMYSYGGDEYLGAAHGLCTILQALLSVPGYFDANPTEARDVKRAVDYLLSLQDKSGNFPCVTNEIGMDSELVHWCHGAPGMIYLMAKAYLVWKEDKYLKSCEKMGELIWTRGLLKKGPGICHGVAGNGYAFLLLYRLTEQPKYLHKAFSFAKFMQSEKFMNEAKTPDNPYSLYEGIAGTACFLGDMLCPQQAVFPFSDVF